jgi:hypothetical protein
LPIPTRCAWDCSLGGSARKPVHVAVAVNDHDNVNVNVNVNDHVNDQPAIFDASCRLWRRH